MMPSVAKRRKIASIRRGGNFVPPSSHQVITAMKTPTTYLTASAYDLEPPMLKVLLFSSTADIHRRRQVGFSF
jgi:hypothetical protein